MNDLFSRDPLKEALLFTIVGLIALPYSIFASKPPAYFFTEPMTLKQKQFTRALSVLVSAFMLLWGVWHLFKAFGYGF